MTGVHPTTRRVALEIDGLILNWWTEVSIERDLAEISGSFELTMRDPARSLQSWPYATPDHPFLPPINWGARATISIDGEPVLIGWVEDVNPTVGDSPSLSIAGRDVTGDLVDCSAAPTGPTEFFGLDLLEIAQRICEPFNIPVTADVDVGEPFDKFALDCGETAMSAIEKGARQRALLIVSDGIGGLVLTRSGQTRAPGDLFLPGNLISSSGKFSSRERFSDYYVKGQSGGGKGKKGSKAGLDGTAQPLGEGSASDAPRPDASASKNQVTILGHAKDEEITRYRPIVAQTRTEASMVDAQTQAEWMARVAEGKGTQFEGEVRDWRINGGLWRPNELVMVDDAYQDLNRDLLISGICYSYNDQGERTRLRLVGPEAYDLIPMANRKKNRKRKGKKGKGGGALDGTAQGLS